MDTPKAGPSGVKPKSKSTETPMETVLKTNIHAEKKAETLQEQECVDAAAETLAQYIEDIKRLVPLQSSTISVADRKLVHGNLDRMYRQIGKMEGAFYSTQERQVIEQQRNEELKVQAAVSEERCKQAEGKALLQTGSIVPVAGGSAATIAGRRVLSYAEKAAGKPTTYKVRIESDNKKQSFEETKKQVQGAINPRLGQLEVIGVSKVKGGAVVVECASQRDCDRIDEAIAAKTTLKSSMVKKHLPRVLLSSVPKGHEHQQICESLFEQNRFIREAYDNMEELKDSYTVLATLKRGEGDSMGVILEVSPALRRLVVGQRVSIDWCRSTITDYISLLQCYRCYNLGHKAAECKQKENHCRRCGAAGHKAESCKAKPSCTVCKHENVKETNPEKRSKTDHCPKATECPVMKRIHEAIARTIDYNG